MRIAIFANALHTNTLTGGDKIFVECARRWIAWGHDVSIITTGSGRDYSLNNDIPRKHIIVWPMAFVDQFGFSFAIFGKSILASLYALFSPRKRYDILFASSFFFPDILPALVYKIRTPQAHLTTSFYIFSKSKWGSDYSGGRLKGFFFYINEVLSLSIIHRFGSSALTASPYDRLRFSQLRGFDQNQVMAVGGGVDNAFFRSIPKQTLKYDAVFVGRFQPQKCIDELIEIWSLVVKREPQRTLALIGGGPQESYLRALVRKKQLQHNVLFFGIMDGIRKAKILKSSRVFVTASRFDTGNIALDEALSCGVGGIIYDLPLLTYDKGVCKIPVGDTKLFCDTILRIVSDDTLRQNVSRDARAYARTIDWDQKAKLLLNLLSVM